MRGVRAIAWRIGIPLIAEDLAEGSDQSVARYYGSRVTDCSFLLDPGHYERPRVEWLLDAIHGGSALEIGCGDGGFTALLSRQVERVVALDVSRPSLRALEARRLANVEPRAALVELFSTSERFQWIVLSEVLEHLREPLGTVRRCLGWLAPGGRLLITTPKGRWESVEHLHDFTMESLCALLARAGARDLRVSVIADRNGGDRWLGADIRRVGQGNAEF